MVSLQIVAAGYELPDDISEGIAQSRIGESGGFGIRGVEEERFRTYIRENWREIMANIETLPLAKSPPGYSFSSKEIAKEASLQSFAAACEVLPPEEYLECMERFLDLYESGKVSPGPLLNQLMGLEQKADFFDVNWEHPRVQEILQRAKKVSDEPSVAEYADHAAKGQLAENYMNDRADGDPGPQTLPGIKLKRPWGSLIDQYEALTGKKAPYHPEYDPRPDKRTMAGTQGRKMESTSENARPVSFPLWPWFAFAGGMVVAAILLVLKRRGRVGVA